MDIYEVLEEYEKNADELASIDEPLHGDLDFDEWSSYMEKRREFLDDSRTINKNTLDFLREYVKNPIPDSELLRLDEEFTKIYFQYDYFNADVLLTLGEAILNAYREKGDTDHTLCYLYRLFDCINSSLCTKCAAPADYSYFNEIREYRKDIRNLSQLACLYINAAYYNAILVYPSMEHSYSGKGMEASYLYYKEYMQEFLPEIREDQKTDDFLQRAEMIQSAAPCNFTDLHFFPKETVMEFAPLIKKRYDDEIKNVSHPYEVDGNTLNSFFNLRLCEGEDPDSLMEEAYQIFMGNPQNGASGTGEFECLAYNNSVMVTDLAFYAKDGKRKEEIIRGMEGRVLEGIEVYKKMGKLSSYNQTLYLWTRNSVRFKGNGKMELILNNVIRSQMPTYIHSKMVKRISEMLFSHFYQKKRDAFESLEMSYMEIMQYIGNAALLHDAGKIAVADLINTQYRSLNDKEFEGLKRHPALGLLDLMKIPELSIYRDPILYHHKWYNGKGGYPEGDDNLRSKYRALTDIITLADCMDAATDNIGRCYKHAKNAYDVLEEFKRDAGVRYNPYFVSVMAEDKELMEELNRITSTERTSMMYLEYKNSREIEKNAGK